jgi:transcriptional regulator with XRE-family HTH domain
MIISGRQIRAARGLLCWSVEDMAINSGVNRVTIRQIEADEVQPQEKTLTRIFSIFDKYGVEFTEDEGVKVRKQATRTYSGKPGYRQLLDHIYETLKDGGRIRQFNFGYLRYLPYEENFVGDHLKRMNAIDNLDVKVLDVGRETEMPVSYCEYRYLENKFKNLAPWYLYGDYLVLSLFETGTKREYITVHSKILTERYIGIFDTFWKLAEPSRKKRVK